MKGYGKPLQYSVFLCDLDDMEKLDMLVDLKVTMNEAVDSVVIVDLGDAATRGMECFQFRGPALGLPRGGPTIV
jgi:CRISPR-associated protein Cas2